MNNRTRMVYHFIILKIILASIIIEEHISKKGTKEI